MLYQLTTSGFVEPRLQPVVKMETSRPGDSLQDIFAKVVDAFNEVYAKIFSAVAQRGKAQPLLKGLESFFGSVAEFAPLFVGLSMDEHGTLSPRAAAGQPATWRPPTTSSTTCTAG